MKNKPTEGYESQANINPDNMKPMYLLKQDKSVQRYAVLESNMPTDINQKEEDIYKSILNGQGILILEQDSKSRQIQDDLVNQSSNEDIPNHSF